ncbi:MAG TPA: sodium-translocating pyrophosphatase [Chloroflexota bacterium]|jgi:K(+)-stimulated pyrophosphate-energized sodium pump|nr:sodium-translocating pyrophosphatase [Chloroflexota bacterium]
MPESTVNLPPFSAVDVDLLVAILACAVIGLGYGFVRRAQVLRADPGTPSMREVAAAIQEGAVAYLRRQLRTMSVFVAAITIALWLLYTPIYAGHPELAIGIALAFLLGCACSYGAGYVGMSLTVQGNLRAARAASQGFRQAADLAFRAGTVSGMFTVGLGLLGATLLFIVFREHAPRVLIGFGFGGSLVAAFMRVGGGIYTKSADIGADMVGKVEAGIPEDDPRNAGVIADNVGDNVGDCAGMAADVFESFEVTLVAAIILGAAALLDPGFTAAYGPQAAPFALRLILFPLLVQGVGMLASILGTWAVRARERDVEAPIAPIVRGFWTAVGAAVAGVAAITAAFLRDPRTGHVDWRFFLAAVAGLALALVIAWLTDLYTSEGRAPVVEMAETTRTGPANFLLTGLGFGLEGSVWALVAVAAAILAAFLIFQGQAALVAYGIALAGLGLMTVTGFILASDTFGPIVDNANGIHEMSHFETEPDARVTRILGRLDAVGNTTKALTKGFAIATAVIAAIALFRSFVAEAHLGAGIRVNDPDVFIGLLVGGAVPFLVSAFLIRAVGRTAFQIVEEVRRQFREIPGLMERKARPRYDRCVDIVTAAAQRELLGPAVVAIAAPILVGFALGAVALGAYLAGAILTAMLMAVFMANTGAAWDNAKKRIEDGALGGKGSDAHKVSVIGDTVGDPLKDTAGPALNPIIKVMNLVAILIAPVVVLPLSVWVRGTVVVAALLGIALAVAVNRRATTTPAAGIGQPERVTPGAP